MKNYNHSSAQKAVTLLLKAFFTQSKTNSKTLISTPLFYTTFCGTTQNLRVVVQLFYYLSPKTSKTGLGLSDYALRTLSNTVTALYVDTLHQKKNTKAKNISVELQVIRQYQPYMNATILAQYLAINASKYGFYRMITMLLPRLPYINPVYTFTRTNTNIPCCITGVKVQLSGLLTSQRNPARKTVYTASAGTFHGTNTTLEFAQSIWPFSGVGVKSREGVFNVKVWLCSTTRF